MTIAQTAPQPAEGSFSGAAGAPNVAPAAKLKPLTSLRFIAAAMIVVFHSQGYFGLPTGMWQSLGQGVSFFFVLSGFILTYVYPSLSSKRHVYRFWIARVARIWPAHVTSLLLVLILLPVSAWTIPTVHPLVGTTNLLMMQSWLPYPEYFFSYNGPSWSISTELSFYLCFPFLIYFWKETWKGKLAAAAALLGITIVMCNWLQLPTATGATRSQLTATAFIYISPIGRLLEFVFGMAVALFWASRRDLRISKTLASTIEIVLIAMIVGGLALLKSQPKWLDPFIGNAGSEYLLHSGCFPLFGALICVMAWGKGVVSALLSHPVPVLLGEVSYSIYLLHQILLRAFHSKAIVFSVYPNALLLLLYLALLIGGSWLIWVVLERPCRRKAAELAARYI